jgi:hypothetical protein
LTIENLSVLATKGMVNFRKTWRASWD